MCKKWRVLCLNKQFKTLQSEVICSALYSISLRWHLAGPLSKILFALKHTGGADATHVHCFVQFALAAFKPLDEIQVLLETICRLRCKPELCYLWFVYFNGTFKNKIIYELNRLLIRQKCSYLRATLRKRYSVWFRVGFWMDIYLICDLATALCDERKHVAFTRFCLVSPIFGPLEVWLLPSIMDKEVLNLYLEVKVITHTSALQNTCKTQPALTDILLNWPIYEER